MVLKYNNGCYQQNVGNGRLVTFESNQHVVVVKIAMIQHLNDSAVAVLIVDGSTAAQEGWQHALELFGVLFKATPLA